MFLDELKRKVSNIWGSNEAKRICYMIYGSKTYGVRIWFREDEVFDLKDEFWLKFWFSEKWRVMFGNVTKNITSSNYWWDRAKGFSKSLRCHFSFNYTSDFWKVKSNNDLFRVIFSNFFKWIVRKDALNSCFEFYKQPWSAVGIFSQNFLQPSKTGL